MLFVGSVGLDVFKHICQDDGISVAYVINTIDHCDDHKEELPPCCEEEKEDDCCDDEVEHIQMKLDFFQDQDEIADAVILEFVVLPTFHFDPATTKSIARSFSNSDPPPWSLSKRLAKNQSYII